MTNEKFIRTFIFIFAAVIHLLVLFFLVFKTDRLIQEGPENARVMKLTDFEEAPPEPEVPQVEAIAEKMVETDTAPDQHVLAAGVFLSENYLSMHQVSVPPKFDANAVMKDLVYPPIALRSGIEGRVILELFVDRTGAVQRIVILQENPEDRGFGEAAIRAFTGRKGVPAYANGEPVSARYRYPVTFKLK
ncbi:MAG: energy transducer TonB [Treponema sp.]|jgi:protein TonB|nr:energy transducer TonB [Treponema sp.]